MSAAWLLSQTSGIDSCGAVVQFLYDLWWGHITPDTDFPKDVRRVLNSAFGELAVRAQQADLKRMLLTYACCLYQPPANLSTVHDTMPWCMHQHVLACVWMSWCCASCLRLNMIGPMMCLHKLFCHLDQAQRVLSLLQRHQQSTHKQIGHFKVKRYC